MRSAVRVVNERPRGVGKSLWQVLAYKYLPTSNCGQVPVLAQVLARVLVQVIARAPVIADKNMRASSCGRASACASRSTSTCASAGTCRRAFVGKDLCSHTFFYKFLCAQMPPRVNLALAALASLSWLRDVDFASVVLKIL
jgi:hypothetical protein